MTKQYRDPVEVLLEQNALLTLNQKPVVSIVTQTMSSDEEQHDTFMATDASSRRTFRADMDAYEVSFFEDVLRDLDIKFTKDY